MSNTYSVRIFNELGLSEAEKCIAEIRSGKSQEIPHELLMDDVYSAVYEPLVEIEKVTSGDKNQLIPYLVDKLQLRTNKDLYFNKGMRSWLSVLFFDNVCPKNGKGVRKVNENAFYILRDPKDYRKYYRHLLAYPARLSADLGDSAKIFLIGDFSKRGEITEQFGAYQEIALNKGILDAANILYWDQQGLKLKRGAAGKGSGSARRLVRIIRQYQLTYDLNSMGGTEVVSLLPEEFFRWK